MSLSKYNKINIIEKQQTNVILYLHTSHTNASEPGRVANTGLFVWSVL